MLCSMIFINMLLVIASRTVAHEFPFRSREASSIIAKRYVASARTQTRCGDSTRNNKNKQEETHLGDWPWIVALYTSKNRTEESSSFVCGGSLIDKEWVLTSAHCIVESKHTKLTHVRLGDLNIDKSVDDKAEPIEIEIKERITHPQYSKKPILNDIALLRLSQPVELTERIGTVCLAADPKYLNETYYDSKSGYVAGWGSIKWLGHVVNHQQEIEMRVVPSSTCKTNYVQFIQSKQLQVDGTTFCATPTISEKDACQGFGGAPLMFQEDGFWYQGGIVSYGYQCNLEEYPTIFTKVAYFKDWIQKMTGLSF